MTTTSNEMEWETVYASDNENLDLVTELEQEAEEDGEWETVKSAPSDVLTDENLDTEKSHVLSTILPQTPYHETLAAEMLAADMGWGKATMFVMVTAWALGRMTYTMEVEHDMYMAPSTCPAMHCDDPPLSCNKTTSPSFWNLNSTRFPLLKKAVWLPASQPPMMMILPSIGNIDLRCVSLPKLASRTYVAGKCVGEKPFFNVEQKEMTLADSFNCIVQYYTPACSN